MEQIIHQAWPQQKRGEMPTAGVAMVTRIEEVLFAYEPISEGQKVLHLQTLQAFNEMAVARRLRVDANREGLPSSMWGVLIFGALLCLFAAGFVQPQAHHSATAPTDDSIDAPFLSLACRGRDNIIERESVSEEGDAADPKLVIGDLLRPKLLPVFAARLRVVRHDEEVRLRSPDGLRVRDDRALDCHRWRR